MSCHQASHAPQVDALYAWVKMAVYMGGGTGRLPGRDVKRDLTMHVYISLICHIPFIWKDVCRESGLLPAKRDPVRSTGIPAKAGTIFII